MLYYVPSVNYPQPMQKYLFILLLLVFSCDEPVEDVYGCTVETACNFNADATIFDDSCGVLDNCGVCDADTSNDCVQDECGEWGGDNSTCTDNCGVINGNNSPNTGICDCSGVPDGTAEFSCGICWGGNTDIDEPNSYISDGGEYSCNFANFWFDMVAVNSLLENIEINNFPINSETTIIIDAIPVTACSLFVSIHTNMGEIEYLNVYYRTQDGYNGCYSPTQGQPLTSEQLAQLGMIIPESLGSLSSLMTLSLRGYITELPSTLCNLPDDSNINVNGNCLSEEYHYDCIDTWGTQDGCE